MRYARRVDANQPLIVDALRAAGATVKVKHEPYDLRVKFAGKSMWFEVKNPETSYGRKGLNAKQLADSEGLPVAMVTDVESALRALRMLKNDASKKNCP